MSDDRQWSEEACLVALERAAEELGHQPRRTEYQEELDIIPSAKAIISVFGSWNAAIEAAGMEPLQQHEDNLNWRHVDNDPPEERE